MMRIHADVPTTRRQRLHHVFDERDDLRFSSAKLAPVFEWLYENGELTAELLTEEHVLVIAIERKRSSPSHDKID